MSVLITGGAGFVGSNLAGALLRQGESVAIYDNFSRSGSRKNLEWLRTRYPHALQVYEGDVRDFAQVQKAIAGTRTVYHLAAQVAVTTSVADPREDFEVNALGTLNVLEAIRQTLRHPTLLYTSTNKVYGNLSGLALREEPSRYTLPDLSGGVSEQMPLDFYSPYGCSKGAAEQYVRDYARIYGLRTVVFRMSCIYGPRQFGNEDQGWLAHFLISAMLGRDIIIYGNGKQVRDLLFIDDLIAAMQLAVAHEDVTRGQIYNIGGGLENAMSIWTEFGPLVEDLAGHPVPVEYREWRPGDQWVYITDYKKARNDFGWRPQIGCVAGIQRLYDWLKEHREMLLQVVGDTSGIG